ncbi:MAG: hypothetical protein CSA53_05660 [Gammaproteobacteria bacterium]|nr:MAG: hypothetical protein CSA53_05660 [Gammaproteobacteria bacterium]
MTKLPTLSVIVIVYDMPAQAMNTLYSLCSEYQRGVRCEDYEVLVLENRSLHTLSPEAIKTLGDNFSYILRDEPGISPVPAINEGLSLCRGQYIGLIIDGARMLSPGVIRSALQALAMGDTIVNVPGYFLSEKGNGEEEPGDILDAERALLSKINWQKNGYRLFENAVFSHGNKRGYINSLMESNALFCPAAWFKEIGGVDQRFTLSGGGSVNLHLSRQLTTRNNSRLITLFGEGNFHQFHGGVSTTAGAARDERVQQFNEQLNQFWPEGFKGITREPCLFGQVDELALHHLEQSVATARQRFARLSQNGKDPWPDETAEQQWHGETRIDPDRVLNKSEPKKPRLSIIVMVYRMARQAMNTLYSLTPAYQQGVDGSEYEVIVVENSSDQILLSSAVKQLGDNFHYTLRQETRPTPVYAVNEGLAQARGDHVCLMVDGARMLSPRVLSLALKALDGFGNALIAVPGYHIGETDQKYNISSQYDETVEKQLLEKIDWKHYGYRLFDISIFSGANPHGLLHPLLESNCLFVPRSRLLAFGGANEGFQSPGGGAFNLDIYRGMARQMDLPLIILHGEGSFHQYHGGVTTMQRDDLDDILATFREEYEKVRGESYQGVFRQPILFGPLSSHSLPFVDATIAGARRRFNRFRHEGRNPWYDDFAAEENHE